MNITNNIISGYIDTLYNKQSEELNNLRNYAEEKHVPIILKDTEGLLMNILKIKKPARLLEIGTAIGYSSACFVNCCGCKVTTIEANEDAYKAAIANIHNLGFDENIEVILGDAREVLQAMGENINCNEKFDLVFIDAAKSHYKAFWDLAIPLCEEDAIIICDNVLMKGMTASDEYDTKKKYKTSIRKMREFISYINNIDYVDTCVLPVGDGISISVINNRDE